MKKNIQEWLEAFSSYSRLVFAILTFTFFFAIFVALSYWHYDAEFWENILVTRFHRWLTWSRNVPRSSIWVGPSPLPLFIEMIQIIYSGNFSSP